MATEVPNRRDEPLEPEGDVLYRVRNALMTAPRSVSSLRGCCLFHQERSRPLALTR